MYGENIIMSIDNASIKASKEHWDHIGKPIGGLGRLEELVSQIAGIQRKEQVRLENKAIVIMCSDNGVCCEGVTQTGKEVTAIVTENFAKGIASVNAMAKVAGAAVFPVDIGIDGEIGHSGVINRKVAFGTNNIKLGPAMTKEQALQAIQTGIDLVSILHKEGYEIIGTGEMGIGNTTTSSAIASVLLGKQPELVTGKGAGLSEQGLQHKIDVIQEAIRVNKPDKEDPLDVLSKLGGYDIAGLTGIFMGGSMYHIPIVIDGVISAVAALIAKRLEPNAAGYMIPSHMGKEPAARLIMEELELEPMIYGKFALGEGTGTAMLFPLLDMALRVYNQNQTFEDIQVEAYHSFDEEDSI